MTTKSETGRTVSESTVSNTELREFLSSVSFLGLTEFRGEGSVSSSQPSICVPKRTSVFLAELTEFAAELSEFSRPKQYSRNSIPPVSFKMRLGEHSQLRYHKGPKTEK